MTNELKDSLGTPIKPGDIVLQFYDRPTGFYRVLSVAPEAVRPGHRGYGGNKETTIVRGWPIDSWRKGRKGAVITPSGCLVLAPEQASIALEKYGQVPQVDLPKDLPGGSGK